MTDQLWEGEDGPLSKKLIGRISNMKQFWNGVSDDESTFEKRRGGKIKSHHQFSGSDLLIEGTYGLQPSQTTSV